LAQRAADLRPHASLGRTILGRLIGGYIALANRTTRWEEHGLEHVAPFLRGEAACILAFWHGRLMLAPHGWPLDRTQVRCNALISQSKDGEVIAVAMESVGLSTIRGSTAKAGKDKGGSRALRDLVKAVRAGDTVAITPDGPKGPRMRASLGTVQLARLTGAPVVPMAWSSRPRIALNSWDRFMTPLPFGAGAFVWGRPITVPREGDDLVLEAARQEIELALNAVTDEADARMGHPKVTPATRPMVEIGMPTWRESP
jgi:lysophospholipid acyltransferase (LPLAT)-like uncharacterized protein